jgi:hypothetical protein
MHSSNHLFLMLYDAMRESLPEAELSKTGAFDWRGYRIDSYQTLATCQYFCQVYFQRPQVIVFQEAYKFKGYRHPFRLSLNLKESNFFILNEDEQRQMLVDFVGFASKQALMWQASSGRAAEAATLHIPEVFSQGYAVARNEMNRTIVVRQVSREYLQAIDLQSQLFSLLQDVIQMMVPYLPEPLNNGVVVQPNVHWRNWDWRGCRLKVKEEDGSVPVGSFDYVFNIYNEEPDYLVCNTFDGRLRTPIKKLNLFQDRFFDKTEEKQFDLLQEFVHDALNTSQPEAVETVQKSLFDW